MAVPAQCRFCLENDEISNLIQPCGCKGSSAYVHLQCLYKWQVSMQADTSDTDERGTICSSCRQPFDPSPPSALEILAVKLKPTSILSSLGMDKDTCNGRENVLFSLIIASRKMSTPLASNSSSTPITQPQAPPSSSSSSSSSPWRTVRERILANIRGTNAVTSNPPRNAHTIGGTNRTMLSALLALVELKRAHWQNVSSKTLISPSPHHPHETILTHRCNPMSQPSLRLASLAAGCLLYLLSLFKPSLQC
jgi:hypothetical protein